MSKLLLACALMSRWTYFKKGELGTFKPIVVGDRITMFADPRSDICVVAFRGTFSFNDLVEDMESQVFQTCDDDSGYLKEFENSFYDIQDQIAYNSKTKCAGGIYLTGHSLGGSMAQIFSRKHKYDGIITFGEPKTCCNKNMGHTGYNLRVVNTGDPIPVLPKPFEVKSIHHCGAKALQLPYNKFIDDYNWPDTITHNHDIFEHDIDRYIEGVRRYINFALSFERHTYNNNEGS